MSLLLLVIIVLGLLGEFQPTPGIHFPCLGKHSGALQMPSVRSSSTKTCADEEAGKMTSDTTVPKTVIIINKHVRRWREMSASIK